MKNASPRTNIAIPWDPQHRVALQTMTTELGAGTTSELGRAILGEAMLCHFGLQRSKELGIISEIATCIPSPMYASYAARKFTEASAPSANAGPQDAPSKLRESRSKSTHVAKLSRL